MASKRKFCLCLLFLLIVSLVLPISEVFADPAAPDSMDFFNYYVNRNLLESGDMLFYAMYDLHYNPTPIPTEAADINFIFKMLNATGTTQLGVALPYAYNDLGYQFGVISFYYDAATVITLGLTFTGTPAYIFRIVGNPAAFTGGTPPYSEAVPSSAYTSFTTPEDNQDQVAARVAVMAHLLETNWVVTLLESQDPGTVLNSAGEEYFRNAIPGIQAMAGNIFFVQSVAIDTSSRVWGNSLDATYKTRLDGTFIKSGLQGVADWLNIPLVLIFGIITIVACIFLIKKAQDKWQTPIAGYVGSLLVIIGMGTIVMGFTVIGLVALALAIAGGWLLFMRKA